jgi:hypothetical protein
VQAAQQDFSATMPPASDAPIVDHAVHYASSHGWRVFPVPLGTKKSHKSAAQSGGRKWGQTIDADEIRNDFRRWPDANVGIVCGEGSKIFVVETDTADGHGDGVDGAAELAKLEARHGALPATLEAMSPSGSVHRYFNHPGVDIKVKTSTSEIGPGIDVRGDGGMVLGVPSVKPDKGVYTWRNDLAIADAPQWLLDKVVVAEKPVVAATAVDERSITERALATISRPSAPPPSTTFKAIAGQPYVEAAVRGEYDAVASIPSEGFQNDQLNVSSMKLGKYVAGGLISEQQVVDVMMQACATNGLLAETGHYGCMATIESGLKFGMTQPKGIPEQKVDNVLPFPGGAAPDANAAPPQLIYSSPDFLADFTPPDYLIDGIVQRRFVYSLTAPTGTGKTAIALTLAAHVALGRSIGSVRVEKGRVLYLAGENPDDIRMRWLASAEKLGFDLETIDVYFLPGVFKISEIYGRINDEISKIGPVALVIVDTTAAYFEGQDENANVQMGDHARIIRSLVTLPGGPTSMAISHPVKNATPENMVPKGGGSFLNEIDGNLICSKVDSVVTLHWCVKHRGPEFTPLQFELHTVTTDRLRDSRGRFIPSVVAVPLSDRERQHAEAGSRQDEDRLLLEIDNDRRHNMVELAMVMNWTMQDGKPYKVKVKRVADRLQAAKLVTSARGIYTTTPAGKKEAKRLKEVER